MAIKWARYRAKLAALDKEGARPIELINRKMEKYLNEIMVSALPSLAQKRRRTYKVQRKMKG